MVTVSGKGGVRRHGGVQCISIVHAAARPLPRRPDQQPDMEMSVLTERNTIGPPSYGDERVDRAQRNRSCMFGDAGALWRYTRCAWGRVGEHACVWVTTFVVGTRSLLSDSRTGDAICPVSVRARFVPCPGARIGTALVRSSCVTARDCRRGARRTALVSD